jgi:uncharacterized protein (TIGR03066 family)
MKMLCLIVASITLLSLTAFAHADDPKNDAVVKLLGKWEVVKTREDRLLGATVTFEKEGKLSVVMKVDGQDTKLDGTYKVEKDKLVSEINGNTDTNTIKKLTDAELELENSMATATTVLKKKK